MIYINFTRNVACYEEGPVLKYLCSPFSENKQKHSRKQNVKNNKSNIKKLNYEKLLWMIFSTFYLQMY